MESNRKLFLTVPKMIQCHFGRYFALLVLCGTLNVRLFAEEASPSAPQAKDFCKAFTKFCSDQSRSFDECVAGHNSTCTLKGGIMAYLTGLFSDECQDLENSCEVSSNLVKKFCGRKERECVRL